MNKEETKLATNNNLAAIAAAKAKLTPAIVEPAPLPVVTNAESPNWGTIEEMETTDLLIPKILHQQATSVLAKAGSASAGDFCDSLTGEVLVKKDEKLELIIFGMYKQMLISKYDERSRKFELEQTIPITKENAKQMAELPFEEEDDLGLKIRNTLQWNFYCLMPKKIDAIPYVISLQSTKAKVAKKIQTMIYQLSQIKRNGASVVFELKSKLESKGTDSWYGLEISQGRDSTQAELLRAHAWYLKSKSEKFVVTEEVSNDSHES